MSRVQCSCRIPVEEGSPSPDPRQGPVQVSVLYTGGRRRLHVGVDGRHARPCRQPWLDPADWGDGRQPRLRRLPVQVVELRHRDRFVACSLCSLTTHRNQSRFLRLFHRRPQNWRIVNTSAYGARPVLILRPLSCGSCTEYIISIATDDVTQRVVYIRRL